MPDSARPIAALDTADPARARSWANVLAPHSGLFKLGLELFLANGPAATSNVTERPVFLDLKLHDIPNTVAGVVRAVLRLTPAMLTLHAAGGAAMIEAARNAAESAGTSRPKLLAVTVLTSLGAAALDAVGVASGLTQQVLRLARLAMSVGVDWIVVGRPITEAAEIG